MLPLLFKSLLSAIGSVFILAFVEWLYAYRSCGFWSLFSSIALCSYLLPLFCIVSVEIALFFKCPLIKKALETPKRAYAGAIALFCALSLFAFAVAPLYEWGSNQLKQQTLLPLVLSLFLTGLLFAISLSVIALWPILERIGSKRALAIPVTVLSFVLLLFAIFKPFIAITANLNDLQRLCLILIPLLPILCLCGTALLKPKPIVTAIASGAFLIAAVVGFGIAHRHVEHVAQFETQHAVAAFGLSAIHLLDDRDSDGYGRFVGPIDCNDQDQEINPLAIDLPDNGIDENCDGQDNPLDTGSKPVMEQFAPLPEALKKRWNFLIISIDAIRADHCSYLGYERNTTPHIDALSMHGLVFKQAYTAANSTQYAIHSLFTGCPYSDLEIDRNGRFAILNADTPTLMTRLKQAGYHTEAHLAAQMTGESFLGLAAGFDLFKGYPAITFKGPSVPTLTPIVQDRLRFLSRKNLPFALWLHYMEPHERYDAHTEFDFGDEPIDYYDGEIAATDAAIGQLMAALKENHLSENTVVVILGDHGEEFKEHGRKFHGNQLYEESIRVPMIIHIPGYDRIEIDSPAVTMDLTPTLAHLAGLEPIVTCPSVSHFNPIIQGKKKPSDRIIYVEMIRNSLKPKARQMAQISWPYKLIYDPQTTSRWLFNLKEDPKEHHNLAFEDPDRCFKMVQQTETRMNTQLYRQSSALIERSVQKHAADHIPKPSKRAVELTPGLWLNHHEISDYEMAGRKFPILNLQLLATKAPLPNIQFKLEAFDAKDPAVAIKPVQTWTPLSGFYPTDQWNPGDLVSDHFWLSFHTHKGRFLLKLSVLKDGQEIYGPISLGELEYNNRAK